MNDSVSFDILFKTNKAEQSLDRLSKKVSEVVRKIDGKFDKLDNALNGVVVNMGKLNRMKFSGFNSGLKSANKQMSMLEKKMLKIGGMSGGAGGRGGSVGGGNRFVSGAMGLVGGVGAYKALSLIGNSASDAMDFETSMKQVELLTKNSSSGSFADLSEKVKSTAAGSVFTMTEVAEATKYLAMAGMELSNIEGSIGTVTSLATATGEDIQLTADKITNLSTAFGITDYEALGDMIAGTLNNANIKMKGFSTAMEYSGAVAAQLGIGFVDLSTAIGTLADNGFQASKIGTALRSGLLNLNAPTAAGAKVLKKFNVELYDTVDGVTKMKTLDKVFAQLGGASVSDIKDLFGKTAAAQATSLIASVKSGEYAEKYGKVNKSRGSVKEMESEMMKTTEGRLKLLQSSWSALTEKIFSDAAPMLISGMEKVTGFMDSLRDAGSGFTDFFNGVFEKSGKIASVFENLFGVAKDAFGSEGAARFGNALGDAIDSIANGLNNVMDKFKSVNGYVKNLTGRDLWGWALALPTAALNQVSQIGKNYDDTSFLTDNMVDFRSPNQRRADFEKMKKGEAEKLRLQKEEDALPLMLRGQKANAKKNTFDAMASAFFGDMPAMFPKKTTVEKTLDKTKQRDSNVILGGDPKTKEGDSVGTLSSPLTSVANQMSRSIVVNMEALMKVENQYIGTNGGELSTEDIESQLSESLLHIVRDYELGMSN